MPSSSAWLGIELKTGEAVKILEMPVIQERIAQYQHFMDQGMVVQEQTEYAIVKNIEGNRVWAGQRVLLQVLPMGSTGFIV